jgi:hypothetical protein
MTRAAIRIPAGEYIAIIKPKLAGTRTRAPSGVVLLLKQARSEEPDQVFSFASWRYLREHLRLFGFASAEELDTADVRLSTGKQPYMFSSRRWEAPLIEALELNST